MKQRFRRLLYGRNGPDSLSRFMMWSALAGLILSFLLQPLGDGIAASVFWLYTVFAIVYCYFRMFSRNLYKRRKENEWFLQKRQKLTGIFSQKKLRFQQRKDYKFFTCPSCKTVLRVPRGKGTIRITCRHCGETFVRKV